MCLSPRASLRASGPCTPSPPEPVPSVTIEVLSPANVSSIGRAELEAKRSLFARIGVTLHLEVDPYAGFIAVWEPVDGTLVQTGLHRSYSSGAIGDVRVEVPSPGDVRVLLPGGQDVLDGGELLAQLAQESTRAEREAARAERLANKLRELGIDPGP